MLFNSITFLLFLPTVFVIYWVFGTKKVIFQNGILLFSSLVFYASWDYRFLGLLTISILLDYFSGLKIAQINDKKVKKVWLSLSIFFNLGFLALFKYYNFFITSFTETLSKFGVESNFSILKIILPIGISFYTFHGLSYVIDVYKNKIKPEKNLINYALFVSYFPLLVAGPIERATHLLPQIKAKRIFCSQKAAEGIKQIVWGFFKKVVVADNCAFFVNQIFDNHQSFSAAELWLGAILFSFQIYGDFSGYSDIAIGVSKLFGIDLITNFKFPYFADSLKTFWQRWHVSLTSWFRDYLYRPLGGSFGSSWNSIRNVFLVFLISGFWHGAKFTFLIYGIIHFVLYELENYNNHKTENTYYRFIKILKTFLLVTISRIFFRAETLTIGFDYFVHLFDFSFTSLHFFYKNSKFILLSFISVFSILLMLFLEYKNGIEENGVVKLSVHLTFAIIIIIFFMGSFQKELPFIYFQF